MTDTVVTQDNCVVSCAPGSTCSGNTGWHQLAAADIEVTQVGQCYQPLAGSRYYNRFNIRGTRVSGGRTLRGAYAMPAMRAWRVQPVGRRSVNAALTHQGAVVLVDGLVGIDSSGSNREWHVLGTVLQLEPLVSGAVTRKVLFPEGYSNLVLIPIADLNQLPGVVPMGSATNGEHHVVEPGLATLHSSSFRALHSTPLHSPPLRSGHSPLLFFPLHSIPLSSTPIWPLSTPVLSRSLHSTLLHDLATPFAASPLHSLYLHSTALQGRPCLQGRCLRCQKHQVSSCHGPVETPWSNLAPNGHAQVAVSPMINKAPKQSHRKLYPLGRWLA